MTTAGTTAGTATTLLVDGKEYAGVPVKFTFDQYAGAAFTADAGAVARRLPSSQLHPLRWFNGRAVAVIEAWDGAMTVGDLPPVRHGGVQLFAMVTRGRSAAPPVLPAVGLMLPVLGDAAGRRYGIGTSTLALSVTNRVAGELNRVLFGDPASLGTLRRERRANALRYQATDRRGGALSLDVPTGGRTQTVDSTSYVYSARGQDLLGRKLHNVAPRQSLHLGSPSAHLDLGEHEWAQLARELGLSTRPALSLSQENACLAMEQAPERLGVADRQSTEPPPPIEPHPAQMSFVIDEEDGSDEVAYEQLATLPFRATGVFEPSPG